MAAWRQLRALAPVLQQEHLIPETPDTAPWSFSEMPADALPYHACLAGYRAYARPGVVADLIPSAPARPLLARGALQLGHVGLQLGHFRLQHAQFDDVG